MTLDGGRGNLPLLLGASNGTASEEKTGLVPNPRLSPAEPSPDATAAPERRRGNRLVLLFAAGAALLSVGGVIGATFVKSPEQLRADAQGPPLSVLTSPVDKRVVRSTVVTRGTVGSARQIEFTPTSAVGAAVALVTAVRVKQGDAVEAGTVVMCVSGRPIIVLPGAVPAYRDLVPNTDGDDVAQLQDALRQLALYSGGDDTGYFGWATKAAVTALYARAGFTVPVAGVAPGSDPTKLLRDADDAVVAAREKVDEISARLAEAPNATTPPGSPTLRQQLATAQKALERAQQDRAHLVATTGPMMPFSEIVFVPSFPAAIAKLTAEVGDPVAPPLITIATGALRVTARMPPDLGKLLRPGMEVEITSESIGQSVRGVVTEIGARKTEPVQGNQPAAPFLPVTVVPSDALPNEWNALDVRLTITAAQTEGEVFVVPVSAVSAGADGRTTVTVMGADGQPVRVEVRAGVSGDGFVEVTPVDGHLAVGDRVVIGQ